MTLRTHANLADPDGAYALLLAAHEGLGEAESHALNARLVLILMNHAGDMEVIAQAIAAARAAGHAAAVSAAPPPHPSPTGGEGGA